MCSVFVLADGLKNEKYSICSALVSAHGLKNEVYSCVVCLFWPMV